MRVLAVDWTGRLKRAEEFLWIADVHEGKLVDLRNGLNRDQLIAHVIEIAEAEPRAVVGLDFAFSFPRWWCEEQGWTQVRDVWTAMAKEGDHHLLAPCQWPFWGHQGGRIQSVLATLVG